MTLLMSIQLNSGLREDSGKEPAQSLKQLFRRYGGAALTPHSLLKDTILYDFMVQLKRSSLLFLCLVSPLL